MGNAPFTIGLRIDNRNGSNSGGGGVHVAGDILEGRVYLEVRNGMQRASSLNVHLVGTETTSIVSVAGTAHYGDNDYKNTLRQTHTIIDVDIPLATFSSGIVRPGRYEYPFRLELPSHLPSTFSGRANTSYFSSSSFFSWGGAPKPVQGHIRYTLEAGLRSPTGWFDSMLNVASGTSASKYRGKFQKQNLSLRAASAEAYTAPPLQSGMVQTGMRQFYFLPTGGTFCHWVEAHTSVVALGEFLVVTLASRNTSHVSLQEIHCELQEEVAFAIHDDRATSCRTLWSASLSAQEVPQLLERRPASRSRRGEKEQDMPRHEVCLTIPTTANPTYHGTLVTVQHYLVVQFIPSSGDVTKPGTKLAIKLVPSPTPAVARPSATALVTTTTMARPSAPPLLEAAAAEAATALPNGSSATTATIVNPSAPPQDEGDVPVAVPVYDYGDDDMEQLPVATEAALPSDWQAITAEVVTISATNPHCRSR